MEKKIKTTTCYSFIESIPVCWFPFGTSVSVYKEKLPVSNWDTNIPGGAIYFNFFFFFSKIHNLVTYYEKQFPKNFF